MKSMVQRAPIILHHEGVDLWVLHPGDALPDVIMELPKDPNTNMRFIDGCFELGAFIAGMNRLGYMVLITSKV